MTSIQLLGGAIIRSDGAPLTGPPAQRHRLALLALLAASWPQAVSRDRAMALLWPEAEPERARRLLNLAVHVLRRAIGEGVIRTVGDGLLFEPAGVHCDLLALRDDRDGEVAMMHTGAFLEGLHLPDAPEFHYWLDERRAELARELEAALSARAARQRDAGDIEGVVATCRRLAAADPFSGSHARALMHALAAAGDRAGALRHAGEHERRLRAELDLAVDAETCALVQQLQACPERTESREVPVLDTHVSVAGDVVTLSIRLVSGDGGSAVSGAVNALVAQAADAVARVMTRQRAAPSARHGDIEEARALCMKAQHLCARREEKALHRAIAWYEEARTLAPTYAAAYTGLANAYAILGFYDLLPPGEAFGHARQAAQTARALDPADPECHAALGYIAKYHDWHWETAERELRDAIALDPRNALAHQWFGNYLALRDHSHDAVASMTRAVQLAPHSAITTAALGWAHYFAGDYARAIDWCEAASELDPQLPVAHAWRAQASQELGRDDDALAAMRTALALSPTSLATEAALAHVLAQAGDHDEARTMLRRISAARGNRYVPPYEIAKVHLALGDRARSLKWLEQAFRDRSHSIGFLRVDPQLAPLHDEPRFRRLLAHTHG